MIAHSSLSFADDLSEAVVHWRPAPTSPSIAAGGVQLWHASLDGFSDDDLKAFGDSLSADEQDRASRYRFEIDRRRFLAGRGALRRILSEYLRIRPMQVAFEYGRWGKPSVRCQTAFQFSVSHCGGLYLVAVSGGAAVGIDVEKLHLPDEYMAIAADCFSPEQVEALNTCPTEDRAAVFCRAWTSLEANCKALGVSLSNQVADSPSVVIRHFSPAPDHVAALATSCDRF